MCKRFSHSAFPPVGPPGAISFLRFACLCAVVLATCGWQPAGAQDASTPFDKKMQWITYSGDHQVKGRWGLHLDGSWREMTASDWVQWLVRPGVNYSVSENADLQVTYSYFKVNPAGLNWDLKSFPENRLHQQIEVRHSRAGLPLRHRFRAEQRWFGAAFERKGLDPGWMQHRLRYLFGSSVPLANRAERGAVAYLSLYNEIMFRIKNAGVSAFEQNRVYAGMGLRPHQHWTIESGVFYQRVQPIRGGRMEDNFVLHTTVRTNLPFGVLVGR